MRVNFLVDIVFIAVYVPVLWHAWRWLRVHEVAGPPSPLRSLTLAASPYPRIVPLAVLVGADVADSPLQFAVLGFLLTVVVESAWRNRERWVGVHAWALGRLRVPAVVVVVASVALLGGAGQLERPGVGVAMWLAAVAMGASVWFVTRRLVLTSWPQKTWRSARPEWGAVIRLGLCVLVAVVAVKYGPGQLAGPSVVLGAVVFLGLVWVAWERGGDAGAARSKADAADRVRARVAMRPGPERRVAVMRVARVLAVAPMVVLALAYVPIVDRLDGWEFVTGLGVFVLCCATVLYGYWLMTHMGKEPWHTPHRWWLTAGIVVVFSGCLVTVAALGRTLPLLVLVLMFAGLLLSEAQRFAETVPVPKGLLFLGFSRTPVVLLLVLCVVLSGAGYPTDAVESWSTNLRQVVRMASTVMDFEPART